ncbi:unnamed protein product [Owenia fusiformis]|uniref:E3 ubiquitin-protein ligase ZNRF1 n=1 Tax=Owenia fusiformis TaxID=6347 RepID=A0A8J1TS98_OWEFU|nr:unnamed protein product [Owenia fusiformis]
MGAKQSTPPRQRTYSNSGQIGASAGGSANGNGGYGTPGPSTSSMGLQMNSRGRARSLGSVQNGHGQPLTIPSTNGTHGTGTLDSDSSTPEDPLPLPFSRAGLSGLMQAHSLPVQLFSLHGIKCPVCSKLVPPDDVECHLVMCLTKPRINYNEDVLTEDKGECVICLEDLVQGDTIARLPCLCIYHKTCIDDWFVVNRSCPEHPLD